MAAVACGIIGTAAVAAAFCSKGEKALGFGLIAVVALLAPRALNRRQTRKALWQATGTR